MFHSDGPVYITDPSEPFQIAPYDVSAIRNAVITAVRVHSAPDKATSVGDGKASQRSLCVMAKHTSLSVNELCAQIGVAREYDSSEQERDERTSSDGENTRCTAQASVTVFISADDSNEANLPLIIQSVMRQSIKSAIASIVVITDRSVSSLPYYNSIAIDGFNCRRVVGADEVQCADHASTYTVSIRFIAVASRVLSIKSFVSAAIGVRTEYVLFADRHLIGIDNEWLSRALLSSKRTAAIVGTAGVVIGRQQAYEFTGGLDFDLEVRLMLICSNLYIHIFIYIHIIYGNKYMEMHIYIYIQVDSVIGSILLRSQWLEYAIRDPSVSHELLSNGVFSALGLELSVASWIRGGIRSVVAVGTNNIF